VASNGGKPVNKNTVFSHAKDLAYALARQRLLGRPIIFVAHSLGGILVKEVGLNAQSRQASPAEVLSRLLQYATLRISRICNRSRPSSGQSCSSERRTAGEATTQMSALLHEE
jgi:hypothetical protein